LTLARIEPDTEVVVAEMGMRGLGQIAALCEVAGPDIAIVTAVGPVHLELLGTVERVAQAKAEIVGALPPGGVVIAPTPAPELEPYLDRDDVEVRRFGAGGDASVVGFEAGEHDSEVAFDLRGRRLELRFNFTSRHQAGNAAAALLAYDALGLPLDEAQDGADRIAFSRWRGEETALPGEGLLINDAYNANPVSMQAALEQLSARAGSRRRVAVLGDMAELGPEAPAYHRQVGRAAAEHAEVLVAVGELAREYLGAGVPEERHAATVEDAIATLDDVLRAGDVVLVKASRSVGLERVAEALTAARV
jgi:UDP-N-acetylmuramoyl-tripeptide--D-alanyl-D-alanine ligase